MTATELLQAQRAVLGDDGAQTFDSLLDRLEHELKALPDKPEETATSTARALWLLAAGVRASAVAACRMDLLPLGAAQQHALADLVAQRLAGTPLAHLTQRQNFMGLEMLAGPQALIPRRETELLAGAAVALLQRLGTGTARPIAIDICTGAANVAAALAHAVPAARVLAADLSPEAVELARRNLVHLGLSHRVELRTGDLLAPFEQADLIGTVDLVSCNPPYISSGRRQSMAAEIAAHEPAQAFDGGPLGVTILQRVLREAPRLLRPGGWLAVEIGAGQGPAVARRMAASGHYAQAESVTDGHGEIRALLAQCTASLPARPA